MSEWVSAKYACVPEAVSERKDLAAPIVGTLSYWITLPHIGIEMEDSSSYQAALGVAVAEVQKSPEADTATLMRQLLTALEQQGAGPNQGKLQ